MFSYYEFVFMKVLIELIEKLKIVLGERMIEFQEKLCTLLVGEHGHCGLTGGVIQAMTKNRRRDKICYCALDLVKYKALLNMLILV